MTLTDKIVIMNLNPLIHGIDPEHVKASIKELKEEFRKGSMATPTAYETINKIFGDKLI